MDFCTGLAIALVLIIWWQYSAWVLYGHVANLFDDYSQWIREYALATARRVPTGAVLARLAKTQSALGQLYRDYHGSDRAQQVEAASTAYIGQITLILQKNPKVVPDDPKGAAAKLAEALGGGTLGPYLDQYNTLTLQQLAEIADGAVVNFDTFDRIQATAATIAQTVTTWIVVFPWKVLIPDLQRAISWAQGK